MTIWANMNLIKVLLEESTDIRDFEFQFMLCFIETSRIEEVKLDLLIMNNLAVQLT